MIRLSLLTAGFVLAMLALASPAAVAAPDGTVVASVAGMATSPDTLPCETADQQPADCAAACAGIVALPVTGEAPTSVPVAAPAPARQAMPRGATLAPDPPPPRPLARV